ncbi:SMI1/KNR4 family protein [Pirellulaceae bacterium SH501]
MPSDRQYASRLSGLLDCPETIYWAIDAFLTVAGKRGYERIVEIAINPDVETEARAKAVRAVGIHSGQSFVIGLPSDPGDWTIKQIPIQALRSWKSDGYKKGPGFKPPKRHADLDDPKSDLDFAASTLDSKLAILRDADQDPVNPSNWLTPARASDLRLALELWKLPKIYIDFHRKYSPLNFLVEGRGFSEGLRLYGASELISRQDGYAFRATPTRPIKGWPKDYVVIADMSGDPYVLDISKTTGNDAPILKARHGEGVWEFRLVHKTFLAFLGHLGK